MPSHPHQAWVSSVSANVLIRALGLAANVILARALGPQDRGIVAALIVWPSMILNLGSLVSVGTVAYFFARRGDAGRSACLMVAAVSAAPVLLLAILVNWVVFQGASPAVFVFASWYSLVIPAVLLSNVFGGIILAQGRFGTFWFTRALGESSVLVATIGLAFVGRLTPGTYVAIALVGATLTLLSSWWLEGLQQRTSFIEGRALAREVVRYGGQVLGTNVPAHLHTRLDQLLISVALPIGVLGLYAVALSWASMVTIVGLALSTVVIGRSVHARDADPASLDVSVRRVRRAALLAIFFSVGTAVLAPVGVPLLFGSEYQGAVGLTVILCFVLGLRAWKGFVHDLARAIGKPGTGVPSELIGLLIAAIALPTLLFNFGAVGVALGALLSYGGLLIDIQIRMSRLVPHGTSMWPEARDVHDVLREARSYLRHVLSRAPTWRKQ